MDLQVQGKHWSLRNRSVAHASELLAKILHSFFWKGMSGVLGISEDPHPITLARSCSLALVILIKPDGLPFFSNSNHVG